MQKIKLLKATNEDGIANLYVIRSMHVTMLFLMSIWILNILDIFRVDPTVMGCSVLLSLSVYLIGLVCWTIFDINKPIMKYFIITWTIIVTTILGTGLTFHAVLATVIPILFCTMHTSKRMIAFTSVLILISTVIIVLVGYRYGVIDINMAILDENWLEYYLRDGTYNTSNMSADIVWMLLLFFVLPRSMIYIMCMIAGYNVARIVRQNAERAKSMEILAERDGMTGLYNKMKYIRLLSTVDNSNRKVAVIYWDVNGLKTLNDTRGHECGDALIRVVAESVLAVTQEPAMSFRIGGDEFVMIIEDGDEAKVKSVLKEWKKALWECSRNCAFEVTASVGYAVGLRRNIKEVVNAADKMMYEDKRKFHECH